jgi:hypothetical protein
MILAITAVIFWEAIRLIILPRPIFKLWNQYCRYKVAKLMGEPNPKARLKIKNILYGRRFLKEKCRINLTLLLVKFYAMVMCLRVSFIIFDNESGLVQEGFDLMDYFCGFIKVLSFVTIWDMLKALAKEQGVLHIVAPILAFLAVAIALPSAFDSNKNYAEVLFIFTALYETFELTYDVAEM